MAQRGWTTEPSCSSVPPARPSTRSRPGGGPARRVFRSSGTIRQVTAVPGARAVLLSQSAGTVSAFALDLGADSVRALGVDAAAAWVVRGTLLYATSAGHLLTAPFDARHLTVRGGPMTILQGIRTVQGLPDATVGRDGTLLYVEGAATAAGEEVRIASVARDGRVDTTWATAWRGRQHVRSRRTAARSPQRRRQRHREQQHLRDPPRDRDRDAVDFAGPSTSDRHGRLTGRPSSTSRPPAGRWASGPSAPTGAGKRRRSSSTSPVPSSMLFGRRMARGSCTAPTPEPTER